MGLFFLPLLKRLSWIIRSISLLMLLIYIASGCQLGRSDYASRYVVSYERAEELYQQKKYKESLELYDIALAQAISGIPEVLDSHLKMAQIYALNKRFADSGRILKNLRRSVQKLPDAEQRKNATQKIEKTEAEIAKIEVKRSAQSSRNFEEIYNQGLKDFADKNYIAAYQLLKRIPRYKDTQDYLDQIEQNLDKTVEDLFQQGFKLYAENRFKEAIRVFNRVLSVNPEHANALEYKEKAQKKLEVLEKIK